MRAGIPRHDFWLLPLVSVATIVVMLLGAELTARAAWPEQMVNACRMSDPQVGNRYRGHCTSRLKTAEGPWVTNDYNDCGYRSPTSCGPVPAGTRRVAIIGTSLAEGYMVEYPDTIGARLAVDLTRMCQQSVEVQNLGANFYGGRLLVPRMAEALRLRPDQVVLVLAPFDLDAELRDGDPVRVTPNAADPTMLTGGLQQRVFGALKQSRTLTVAQHFLFQNPSVYLPLYLRYGDKADFLRQPFSPNWQKRLRHFDALMGQLANQAHASGVPLTFAFIPQEAQIALMAGRRVPPGIDPSALQAALRAIAGRWGVGFIDASLMLLTQRTPERLYYQVDGHLSGRGQPLAAAAIAQALANTPGGPFTRCREMAPSVVGLNG